MSIKAFFKEAWRLIKARSRFASSQILPGAQQSPDEVMGELFSDVQMRQIYRDGMTFVDLAPEEGLRSIVREYQKERLKPGFDLVQFVQRNFSGFVQEEHPYRTNPNHTVAQHIEELWDVLTREAYSNRGTQIALPHRYIVPGGRFGAQWYWDSYFVMLGLAASGRWERVEGMIKNYAFMLRKFGRIPSASRTYYLSRSQPPMLALAVKLLASHGGKAIYVRYLPYLLAEYRFWMKDRSKLEEENLPAYRRVVRMPDGSLLNRYYDDRRTPRPESFREDMATAQLAPERLPSQVFLDLRAAAESGWDFSSRWLADEQLLHTIHTTDFAPVDLNCLLYMLEETIADIYRLLKQPLLARPYAKRARQRAAVINKWCWSAEEKFYYDYDFIADRQSPAETLAAVFPLFAGVASQKQADAVAQKLKADFLKPGGLVTTLVTNGQQWDSPNGWAPLQWVAIEGLRRYGHDELADQIKKRWIKLNTDMFKKTGKLVEKYNVLDEGQHAGGGEYPLQDGFGWTNGVLLWLLKKDKH